MNQTTARKHKKQFLEALKDSLESQMIHYPERFADSLRKDKKYPKKFADHIWQKLVDRKVFVINETVAEAMEDLGLVPSIERVYDFTGLMPPNGITLPTTPSKKVSVEKITKPVRYAPFRGC